MLGPRGLTKLVGRLNKYRFKKKKKATEMNSYERYVSKRYDHSVYFENLTRLLHIYQVWGHEVYPKYKFRDFITVLNRAASSTAVKEYKRALIRKEVDEKLKIEAVREDEYASNGLTSETRNSEADSSIGGLPTSSLFVSEDAEPGIYGEEGKKEDKEDADDAFIRSLAVDTTKGAEKDKEDTKKEEGKKDQPENPDHPDHSKTNESDQSEPSKTVPPDSVDILAILKDDEETAKVTDDIVAQKDADLKEDGAGAGAGNATGNTNNTKTGTGNSTDNNSPDSSHAENSQDDYADELMHEMGL